MINKNDVLFAKVHSDRDFTMPQRDDENGWYDLYASMPVGTDEIVIPAHSLKLIPTNLCSAFHSSKRVGLFERGSNTKSNTGLGAGRIDSGYRGEWFVAFRNHNPFDIVISRYTSDVRTETERVKRKGILGKIGFTKKVTVQYIPYKKAICQFAIEEVPQVKIKEVDVCEIREIPSSRGEGKLGSSGR